MKAVLVSCDPGGSNAVFPLKETLIQQKWQVELWGKDQALPQYKKFGQVGKDISKIYQEYSLSEAEEFITHTQASIVVTGTSGHGFIEKDLWLAAKTIGVPSIAVLDQWSNYRIRFSEKSLSKVQKKHDSIRLNRLPTKICVMDKYAKNEMIGHGFKAGDIVVTGHPYFELLSSYKKKQLSKPRLLKQNLSKNTYKVLFASEPMSNNWCTKEKALNIWGYNEFTVLEALIKSLVSLSKDQNIKIELTIRLHPKEKKGKFDQFIKNRLNSLFTIKFNQTEESWDQILSSDLICGMSSMFLIESLILEKPVLSIQLNLRTTDPFVFSRRKITKTITTESELNDSLIKSIKSLTKPKIKIIQKPVENVIRVMESLV